MKVICYTSSTLLKCKNTKAKKKFSLRNAAPFLKERVDHLLRRWWIVDSTLLEQGERIGMLSVVSL